MNEAQELTAFELTELDGDFYTVNLPEPLAPNYGGIDWSEEEWLDQQAALADWHAEEASERAYDRMLEARSYRYDREDYY